MSDPALDLAAPSAAVAPPADLRRIPHLGHALLLIALFLVGLFTSVVLILVALHFKWFRPGRSHDSCTPPPGGRPTWTAPWPWATWIPGPLPGRSGLAGYIAGLTAAGSKIEWKLTEHTSTLYGFSRPLAGTDGIRRSIQDGGGQTVVPAMWDTAAGRYLNVGTTEKGRYPGILPVLVEDVNSWSYLCSPGPRVRAIARLGTEPPGRGRGWLPSV